VRVALILILVAVAPAAAEGIRVDVELGDTAKVDVGTLTGLHCDDVTIIKVDLVTRDDEHNDLVVTGVAVGTTLCRVGTAAQQARLYDIHVIPKAKRAPRPSH
jgi:hypothetical protein